MKKNLPPHFFTAVCLRYDYIDYKEKMWPLEEEGFEIYRAISQIKNNQNPEEDKQLTKLLKQKKELQTKTNNIPKNKPEPLYSKGYFQTQKEAIDFIQDNQQSIHEGCYFPYIVVERRFFGWEAYDLSDSEESEVWFKGEKTGPEFHDYKYTRCEKPEFFKNVFGFGG
jgi:hypothetical protein